MPLLMTLCAFTFFVLSFRCLLLALFERKSGSLRFLDFFAALLLLLCGLLIRSVAPLVFNVASLSILVVIAVLILLPAIRRINIPYKSRPGLAVLKTLFLILLFLFVAALLLMQGFQRFYEDHPVLKVTMTGVTKQEDLEWKPPDFPLQHQKLTSYEVVLNQPDGKPVTELFLYGDEVALKAKVIRFKPSLAMLGLRSLYKIEFVYNGYTTAQRHNFYPHRAVEIPTASPALKPWQERLWQYWEKLYYHQGSNAFVKTATLESTFFPLVDSKGQPFRGSYYLTVNAGGLSGIRAN